MIVYPTLDNSTKEVRFFATWDAAWAYKSKFGQNVITISEPVFLAEAIK